VTRPRLATLVAVAIGIGVIDAVAFVVFEAVIDDGSDEVWNTLARTDQTRWLVIPLAIVLSICFSFVVRLVGQSRYVEPETDLLAEGIPSESATLASIGVIFLVGAVSLIAGASLGPEASLVALSLAIGSWLAGRSRAGDDTKALVVASVGALLVAFLGSLVPVLIPLVLLRQQKMWTARRAVLAVVAGVAAYITLFVIQLGSTDGYGTIPASTDVGVHDFITALVLGVLAVFVARGFHRLVGFFLAITKRLDTVLPWTLSAALFGAGLGIVYLAGGQTIEFSGQAGTKMLLERAATYSAIALGGLALAKLTATAWSLTTGYRGGVVFPSIFMAVATGLFVSSAAGSLGGPGVVVGVVAGILTALTGAAFAIVLLISLLPAKLIGVAAVGAVGAVLCDRALTRVAKRPA
jgi:H+/Cl- antiporter ClcA